MVNVIQTCAIELYKQEDQQLTVLLLQRAIQKEVSKEGMLIEKSNN